MRDFRLFLALAALSWAIAADAGSQRTFVATNGNDGNPCSLALPCRSFARAITQTAGGGELIVLDSGGYGPVTINGSVSLIAAPGVYAGITATSGDAISVAAPGAIVVLKGLTINGQGNGGIGVNVQIAARLRIENCTISNMASNGVLHAAPGAEVVVVDSIVRDNGGTGIGVAADATIVLDRVRSEHNVFDGFFTSAKTAGGEATATIADSVFEGNGGNGVSVSTIASQTVNLHIERTTIAGNANDGVKAVVVIGSRHMNVTLARNAIARNGRFGVELLGGPTQATVTETQISRSAGSFGQIFVSGSNARLLLANTTFGPTGDDDPGGLFDVWIANNATVLSAGNNYGFGGVAGTKATAFSF